MKRVIAAAMGTLLLAALAFLSSSADAGGGATVSVLHGIGPAPQTVDIYLGPTDATEWDLLLESVDYGDLAELGTVPGGGYNVLICTDEPGPADDPITGCVEPASPARFAVNGNFGTNITIPDSGNVTIVASYSDPEFGRPTVQVFENDVSCYEAGDGRLGARHAATLDPVDVLVDGEVVLDGVAWGEGADLDVPAGDYEVEIQLDADNSTVLGPTTVTVEEGQLLVLYAVGNIQFDANPDVLTQTIDLDPCPVETTTTSTTTPPAPPAPPVSVAPDFTG